jgi:hypothetical protein
VLQSFIFVASGEWIRDFFTAIKRRYNDEESAARNDQAERARPKVSIFI